MWHPAHSGIEKSAMAFEETTSKVRKNEKQEKAHLFGWWAQSRL